MLDAAPHTRNRAPSLFAARRGSAKVEEAWRLWNLQRKVQQRKDKLASNHAFLLHRRMGSLLRAFLGTKKGNDRTLEILGYTEQQLVLHFERQFLPGMGWHNIRDWHIDHIVPLVEFKCQSADDLEFRAAWALSNLRPIWAKENLSKGAKRVFLL